MNLELLLLALGLAFGAGLTIGFRMQPRRRRRRARAQLRALAAAARAELASNRHYYRASRRRHVRWGLTSRTAIAADRRATLQRARLRSR